MEKRIYRAYAWEDLVTVFPEAFHNVAHVFLCDQDDITFGDAEYTLIPGIQAYEFLVNAWQEWPDNKDYDGDAIFGRLPTLTDGSLVAILG